MDDESLRVGHGLSWPAPEARDVSSLPIAACQRLALTKPDRMSLVAPVSRCARLSDERKAPASRRQGRNSGGGRPAGGRKAARRRQKAPTFPAFPVADAGFSSRLSLRRGVPNGMAGFIDARAAGLSSFVTEAAHFQMAKGRPQATPDARARPKFPPFAAHPCRCRRQSSARTKEITSKNAWKVLMDLQK